MGILRYISLIFFFLFISCNKNEYLKDDSSFYGIYLKEWNSSLCPKKVLFEKYEKNSNFKKIIKVDTSFNIEGCESRVKEINQRIFTPIVPYTGKIDYDVKLIIDDSLEFRITSINNKIDTVFSGGHPGDFIIMNNISSFIVNGHNVDNSKAPLNIEIPTKMATVLKR